MNKLQTILYYINDGLNHFKHCFYIWKCHHGVDKPYNGLNLCGVDNWEKELFWVEISDGWIIMELNEYYKNNEY
jgi:hypothetical protein